MAEVLFQPAWRRDDPNSAADALALWQRLEAMPPQVAESRVKELCAVALHGVELVGVSTVVPLFGRFFLTGSVSGSLLWGDHQVRLNSSGFYPGGRFKSTMAWSPMPRASSVSACRSLPPAGH